MDVFNLSQRFYFEAAHTLDREHEREGSRRIHGHTYEAEVTLTGAPNKQTGMLLDIQILRNEIQRIRVLLDHQFLDEVQDLGPATLENLTLFIRNQVRGKLPNVSSVMVERRASGDRCVLTDRPEQRIPSR